MNLGPFPLTDSRVFFLQFSSWAWVILPQLAGLGLWSQGAPATAASAAVVVESAATPRAAANAAAPFAIQRDAAPTPVAATVSLAAVVVRVTPLVPPHRALSSRRGTES